MTGAQTAQTPLTMGDLAPLLGAWVGFGLFSIAGSVLVALNADRLSHRRRLGMMASYFDHVLHLPLSFHSGTHSGRLLKIMLDGAQAMFWIWLSFFRENCASAVALFVLLPLTLFVNWRLAAVLIILVICFRTAHVLCVAQDRNDAGRCRALFGRPGRTCFRCARQCACNSKLYADREQIPGHARDH